MTEEQLNEIEARANRATKGPWSTERPEGEIEGFKKGTLIAATYGRQYIWADPGGGAFPANDQRFIAAARTDVPALTAEIRRMWKMERLRLEANNRDLERRREAEHTAEMLRKENAALTEALAEAKAEAQRQTECAKALASAEAKTLRVEFHVSPLDAGIFNLIVTAPGLDEAELARIVAESIGLLTQKAAEIAAEEAAQ